MQQSKVSRDNTRFKGEPLGLGVFCNRRGEHIIHFKDFDHKSKTKMTSLERRYAVESGYDGDYIVVHGEQKIKSNQIHFSWRINHSSTDPTHKLCWEDEVGNEHPYLEPLRIVEVGEEFTFKYY